MPGRPKSERFTKSASRVAIVIALLVVYFAAYYAIIEAGKPFPQLLVSTDEPGVMVMVPDYSIRGDDPSGWRYTLISPEYDLAMSQIMKPIFFPAHYLDRLIRPSRWRFKLTLNVDL